MIFSPPNSLLVRVSLCSFPYLVVGENKTTPKRKILFASVLIQFYSTCKVKLSVALAKLDFGNSNVPVLDEQVLEYAVSKLVVHPGLVYPV
jgi:hypothetical protein